MQPNEDIYYIPVNFTDAGRVLGLFELRNCIEAAVLAAPTVGLCTLVAQHTPFSLTVKLILSLCLLVPVCGFALAAAGKDIAQGGELHHVEPQPDAGRGRYPRGL